MRKKHRTLGFKRTINLRTVVDYSQRTGVTFNSRQEDSGMVIGDDISISVLWFVDLQVRMLPSELLARIDGLQGKEKSDCFQLKFAQITTYGKDPLWSHVSEYNLDCFFLYIYNSYFYRCFVLMLRFSCSHMHLYKSMFCFKWCN